MGTRKTGSNWLHKHVLMVLTNTLQPNASEDTSINKNWVRHLPPPPCPANNKILKEIRSEQECSWDTPFDTHLTQYLSPVPH